MRSTPIQRLPQIRRASHSAPTSDLDRSRLKGGSHTQNRRTRQAVEAAQLAGRLSNSAATHRVTPKPGANGRPIVQRRGYFARGKAPEVRPMGATTLLIGWQWHEMYDFSTEELRFTNYIDGRWADSWGGRQHAPIAIIGTGEEIIRLLERHSTVRLVNEMMRPASEEDGGAEPLDERQRVYMKGPEPFKPGLRSLNPAGEAAKSIATTFAGFAPGGSALVVEPSEITGIVMDYSENAPRTGGGPFRSLKKKYRDWRARQYALTGLHIITLHWDDMGGKAREIGRGQDGTNLQRVLTLATSTVPAWRGFLRANRDSRR